ncbi:unnamed protein product, partial [Didymodactylos carnosus]
IAHHSAQDEWNAIKKNEEHVQEKIEEYLEIYQRSGASGLGDINQPPQTKKKKYPKKKKAKKRKRSDNSDIDEAQIPVIEVETAMTTRSQTNGTNGEFSGPPSKISTLSVITPNITTAQQKQLQSRKAKKIRAPAQELVSIELTEVNEKIVSLIQLKNMGLATDDSKRNLKKLFAERKKKSNELKRLKTEQVRKAKFRQKKKQIVEQLCEKNPEIAGELSKIYRTTIGRPPIEEQCPDLLQIIEEIAKCGGASDDKRRSEQIRPCLTLDDLREKIKQRGYDIKRSTLYYRLLPRRPTSIDGRRHVRTVPVRLRRAQNNDHGKHEDGHFATATIRYIKDLAGIFGNDVVFFLSQDDKCKVPIGLPAAKIQAPMLMHLDYAVKLPDHDWTVAPRHQLTPSVYAACVINPDGDVGYSGPTYIAVRSAKHDRSDAQSHAKDFDTLVQLKEFEKVCRDLNGNIKPIVIVTVDGGPDENPRFPKTLMAAIRKFRRYNLDALFILTHAPGQSAYNVVERRMAPLSHDLAGLILPHDHFGTHLNDSGITINTELEKTNFKKAGEVLAEVWRGSVIDDYPVVAEYIDPPATTDNERRVVDVTFVMDNLLKAICAEEEAEEGHEFRIHASDEYYQEKARLRQIIHDEELVLQNGKEHTKYDIDEYWCATHVLQTQYTIQIVRCNNALCCGKWRSNYVQIFPHRFLPPPVPFERTPYGIQMADKDSLKNQFYGSLFHRIQFHGVVINHTKNDMLPFDYCCSSVKKELKKRICKICKQYIPSAYRMKQHYKIHQQYQQDSDEEGGTDDLFDLMAASEKNVTEPAIPEGAVIFNDMLDWLKSDFEELDLQEQKALNNLKATSKREKSTMKLRSNSTTHLTAEQLEKLKLNENGHMNGKDEEQETECDGVEENGGDNDIDADWTQVDI